MNTEHHKQHQGGAGIPQHDNVAFEPRDVQTSTILKLLAYLGVAIILSYVLTTGIYRGLTSFWNDRYTVPPPSRGDSGPTYPPSPRLQGLPGSLTEPQDDWRNMVKAAATANNTLGWVDEKNGVAQIPVKDAMDLIVEKGLPVFAAAPAASSEEKK
jgi:hypothetical protein